MDEAGFRNLDSFLAGVSPGGTGREIVRDLLTACTKRWWIAPSAVGTVANSLRLYEAISISWFADLIS
jgi:hypothetical protein